MLFAMQPSFDVIPPARPGTIPPPAPKRSGGFFTAIGAMALVALKFGFLALKSLKTGLSMLLMIWVYSLFFGWKFAAGFVVLLFVHEMGHVIAAKLLGMPVTAPIFIPFVGAAILMKQNPRDAWTEALMAYGGPLAGCIGSWLCLWGGGAAGMDWIVGVASASFVLNLFNLIPVPPLDGGRICAAVSRWFWLPGLLLLLGAVFFFHSTSSIFIVVLVIFFAFSRIKQTFFQPLSPELSAYYATKMGDRIAMALMYLGLIAALLLGYAEASQQLQYVWDQSSGESGQ